MCDYCYPDLSGAAFNNSTNGAPVTITKVSSTWPAIITPPPTGE